jgi:D-alanyl-D-alanine carboxypeptidase
VDAPASLDAPLSAGARVGEVIYSAQGHVIRRVDLVAADTVLRGNIFILIRDVFAKFFTRLFGGA